MVEPKQVILPGKGYIITSDGTETVTLAPGATGDILQADGSAAAGLSYVMGDGHNNLIQERPNRIFLGNLMNYGQNGSVLAASNVIYVRSYYGEGTELDSMEVFLHTGGNGARSIRLGMYSQTTPMSFTELPNAKVAETASYAPSALENGSYILRPLLASYTVPTSGYYWLALIADVTNLKFAVSDPFVPAFLPLTGEASVGTTLPATATSALVGGSVPWLAAVRV